MKGEKLQTKKPEADSMEMKEHITQEEAAARGMMEAEYDQLAELVTAL